MKKSVNFAIIATMAMLIILMTFIVFVKLSVQLDELDHLVIETPDLSEVSDGTYVGSHETFPISVNVNVTIIDHQFDDIIVTGQSLFFNQQAALIIPTILDLQDLNVELSEEHEYSEKILLLAIINAIDTLVLFES